MIQNVLYNHLTDTTCRAGDDIVLYLKDGVQQRITVGGVKHDSLWDVNRIYYKFDDIESFGMIPTPMFETSSKRSLIGIAGRKGHGKDTAAQALVGYENVKFAGALKVMVRAYMEYVGVSAETIERCVDGDMKETPMSLWGGKTTRYVMQTLGTEWGRGMVWDELWVNAFRMRAAQFDKVVCTDMRFPNEVEEIEKLGGLTIKVVRPGMNDADSHPSEALIDTLSTRCEILNGTTVERLHRVVNSMVRSWLSRAPEKVSQHDVKGWDVT